MTAFQDLARDFWPQARIQGDGRFASVHSCNGSTVELRPTKQHPRPADGCNCSQAHELVLDE